MRQGRVALAVAALALGCDRGERTAAGTTARGTPARGQDTVASAGGMAGMPGMGRAAVSVGMMTRMEAHLRGLEGMDAGRLAAGLPEHRQLVANLVAQTNREMREMGMAGDAAWTATVDSLRQDLVRLPELGRGELTAVMPAHRGRVERLIAMHRQMLARM